MICNCILNHKHKHALEERKSRVNEKMLQYLLTQTLREWNRPVRLSPLIQPHHVDLALHHYWHSSLLCRYHRNTGMCTNQNKKTKTIFCSSMGCSLSLSRTDHEVTEYVMESRAVSSRCGDVGKCAGYFKTDTHVTLSRDNNSVLNKKYKIDVRIIPLTCHQKGLLCQSKLLSYSHTKYWVRNWEQK